MIFQILPTFRHRMKNPVNIFDCNTDVYMYFFIALKNPANMFDCNTDVYLYFLRLLCAKTALHRLTSRKLGRWERWPRKTAAISDTQFCTVRCCRIKYDSVPLLYRLAEQNEDLPVKLWHYRFKCHAETLTCYVYSDPFKTNNNLLKPIRKIIPSNNFLTFRQVYRPCFVRDPWLKPTASVAVVLPWAFIHNLSRARTIKEWCGPPPGERRHHENSLVTYHR